MLDHQYDDEQISQSEYYWQRFLPEMAEKVAEKQHFYKSIHAFSGFHKKVYDEDIKKEVDLLIRHDSGDQTWVEPIMVCMANLLANKSLSIAGDGKYRTLNVSIDIED